nr:hypothetical protein Iba_chr06cCG7550 [Ipomoea batatas]
MIFAKIFSNNLLDSFTEEEQQKPKRYQMPVYDWKRKTRCPISIRQKKFRRVHAHVLSSSVSLDVAKAPKETDEVKKRITGRGTDEGFHLLDNGGYRQSKTVERKAMGFTAHEGFDVWAGKGKGVQTDLG